MSRLLAACLGLGLLAASTAARGASPHQQDGQGHRQVRRATTSARRSATANAPPSPSPRLKSVGAKTTYDYGISGLDKDYKWGTLVKDPADARPGDIIQFRDVVTVTKTVTKTAAGTTTRTMTRDYPTTRRSSRRTSARGKSEVYEQNSGGSETSEVERKKVRENPLDLAGKTKGTVWIYRPVKK